MAQVERRSSRHISWIAGGHPVTTAAVTVQVDESRDDREVAEILSRFVLDRSGSRLNSDDAAALDLHPAGGQHPISGDHAAGGEQRHGVQSRRRPGLRFALAGGSDMLVPLPMAGRWAVVFNGVSR